MKNYNQYIKEGLFNRNVDWDEKLFDNALKGNLKGVIKAIEKGADVNHDNNKALRQARYNNHMDIVKYLISKGSLINNKPFDS